MESIESHVIDCQNESEDIQVNICLFLKTLKSVLELLALGKSLHSLTIIIIIITLLSFAIIAWQ